LLLKKKIKLLYSCGKVVNLTWIKDRKSLKQKWKMRDLSENYVWQILSQLFVLVVKPHWGKKVPALKNSKTPRTNNKMKPEPV
jgi:hypothetical protein